MASVSKQTNINEQSTESHKRTQMGFKIFPVASNLSTDWLPQSRRAPSDNNYNDIVDSNDVELLDLERWKKKEVEKEKFRHQINDGLTMCIDEHVFVSIDFVQILFSQKKIQWWWRASPSTMKHASYTIAFCSLYSRLWSYGEFQKMGITIGYSPVQYMFVWLACNAILKKKLLIFIWIFTFSTLRTNAFTMLARWE